MAVKLSKALADALAAGKAVVNVSVAPATTISFGDGTGSGGNDQILDSGNNLGDFHVGDKITTITTSTTNDGTFTILAVVAGAIEVPAGSFTTEAAGQQVALASARGHSIADLLKYGVMGLYSGARPASPETTEAGTLLLIISESSGAFVGGQDANGLLFDAVVDGVLSKSASQVWSDTGLNTGTLTWGRFYANDYTTGADAGEVLIRFDFDIATSGSDLNMSTSVVSGNTKTIDEFTITVPSQ